MSALNNTLLFTDSVQLVSPADAWAIALFSVIIEIGAIPSLLLFFYVTYVMYTQSPPHMRATKWLLLNVVVTCFVYDLTLCVWKPVTVPNLGNSKIRDNS